MEGFELDAELAATVDPARATRLEVDYFLDDLGALPRGAVADRFGAAVEASATLRVGAACPVLSVAIGPVDGYETIA